MMRRLPDWVLATLIFWGAIFVSAALAIGIPLLSAYFGGRVGGAALLLIVLVGVPAGYYYLLKE